MSKKFDWQADDNLNWDDLSADEETTDSSPKRRRWPVLLLILLLLAGAAGLILRQVDRRVDENTQAMRADIISSHNLLQLADADQDDELFFSVLSGSNSSWTAAQKDLFDAGLFYNRAPLGLSAPQTRETLGSAEDDSLTITFTPDLRGAEVISEQPFAIEIGHGLTETVMLQETKIYRLGRERWLLSPPEEDFWGSQSTQQGSRLLLSTPERDAKLAERLLPDLGRKLDEMCQSLVDINCPSDIVVEVRFSTDPASLIATTYPLAVVQVGAVLQIVLPTPTLIGIPVDETGYQALFRGYAGQIVTAVISHLVDFDCCRHAVFHQALVHHQLDQLSLKPWPVTTIDYQRILDEQLQIADIDALWRSEDAGVLTGSEGWRVYAFLDYLLKTYPSLNTVTLQRELMRHEIIYGWLDDSFTGSVDDTDNALSSDLIRQFWLKAYIQTFSTGSNSLAPPPTQDLQITCIVPAVTNPTSHLASLYRYDIGQDKWTEEYSTINSLFMNPLPDDEGLILVEYDSDDRWWQTQLWQDGRANPILAGSDQQSVSFGHTDPDGSSLTAFVFPPNGEEAIITLFDLNQCDTEGCSSRVLPSIPIWSPDGSQAIFTDEPNAQLALLQSSLRTIMFDSSAETPALQLYHTDRPDFMEGEALTAVAGLTDIGKGHAPFWLDNETVGYVALANGRFSRPGQELVLTPAGEDNHQELLTINELLTTFPDPASVERIFWIHYVMVHPANPKLLFVVALSGWDQQAHLFTYDRGSGEVQHLMQNSYAADHTLTLSPDGDFQVLAGRNVNHPGIDRDSALLLLHDLDLNTSTPFLIKPADFPPFPMYDWSSDGEWLAMMLDQDLIGLFSPKQSELKLIESASGNCSSPAWINR